MKSETRRKQKRITLSQQLVVKFTVRVLLKKQPEAI
jgi:hypothetical protein